MNRTSISHPLQIASVCPGRGFGRVGITLCPGKYDRVAQTGAWDRDLGIDLDAIRTWGATAVVALVVRDELKLLRVPNLGDEVSRRGMSWFHLPIVDVSIPGGNFENAWELTGEQLRLILRSGADMVVHCRSGLGRAGTIAARLLIGPGMMPERAITELRWVGPTAIIEPCAHEYCVCLCAGDSAYFGSATVIEPVARRLRKFTGWLIVDVRSNRSNGSSQNNRLSGRGRCAAKA